MFEQPQGNEFFKVKDKDGKWHYFDLKTLAKKFRDKLIAAGFKAAHVSFGPDHPNHVNNRRKASWNKGHHPKRKAKQLLSRKFV